MADETIPTWGYSRKDAQIFDLKQDEALPDGYFDHPAKIPGSSAQKQYIADAEAEGAALDFIKPAAKPDGK